MARTILLVGSGGREHALAWKLARSADLARILVAPGNPGIAGEPRTTCIAVKGEDTAGLLALVEREKVDFVVCGPEVPLVAGLGDAVRQRGVPFFGPSARAAEIEGSKIFAKELMTAAGVPTAAFGTFDELGAAEAFVDRQPNPVVVKADGLAAGKGVVVASSRDEAKAAVRRMMAEGEFGAAGARVVIEERLAGRECSMMALTDGEQVVMLASSEDHKQVHDGDRGPNTGGMGTYSPSPLVDEKLTSHIVDTIFVPTVRAMARAGRPFQGLLYGGLMLTPDRGPMVIEFNCRFGDPETQSVIPRLRSDLLPWLLWSAGAGPMPGSMSWHPGAAVCVVLAAEGYPAKTRTGDVMEGLPEAASEDLMVFHAGTRREDGRLLTAGGRVLGVTALGADLTAARARAYGAIDGIHWPGMHYRKDIGARGQNQ